MPQKYTTGLRMQITLGYIRSFDAFCWSGLWTHPCDTLKRTCKCLVQLRQWWCSHYKFYTNCQRQRNGVLSAEGKTARPGVVCSSCGEGGLSLQRRFHQPFDASRLWVVGSCPCSLGSPAFSQRTPLQCVCREVAGVILQEV